MAGLGAKNWTFEEEATSSDINGFLADQVVMRFANAASRDAGFGGAGEPSLAEGMICTLDDTNEVQRYSGSAWVTIYSPNFLIFSSSSLSNNVVAFAAERNAVPALNAFWAFGNGGSLTAISIPVAGKLVAATFTATSDINGTIMARPNLNGSVLGVGTYDLTVNAANPVTTYDFSGSPLAIPAGQRLNWQCTAVTATAGLSTITFYIRFD